MLNINKSSIQDLKEKSKIDLFICAIGFEYRASYLASLLADVKIVNKLCIVLVEEPNQKQSKILESLGFEFVKMKNYKEKISELNFKSIVIDYSVMMKSLYSDLLIQLVEIDKKEAIIDIYFSYTNAIFEKPKLNSHYIDYIKPILLDDNKILNPWPVKLIISLGYERLSPVGVIEYFEIDYSDVIVFINKENENSDFYKECLKSNKELLTAIDDSQIFELNFFDFTQMAATLESVLLNIYRNNHLAIIAPMSVKCFSLFSMIRSMDYPNVRFYNVSSKSEAATYRKIPDNNKSPTVYKYEIPKTPSNML